MKLHQITRIGLPVFAVTGAAAMLATAPETEGYTLLGNEQGIFQRDFRVNPGLSNGAANNNTTEHSQYPGATGQTLAMWRGCVEWNSQLHGNGNGDPTQSGDLGSGGANFDCHFQGETTQTGTINDNIISPIGGAANGVLAYLEYSGFSTGWRMRFYSTWNWSDGPGFIANSEMDIQGVAAHEYGHALGLGHTFSGPTMQPSIGPGDEASRSIEADDKAGVQAIYGVANFNTKPQIHDTTLIGNTLTITGENFTSTNNRVWFTKENNTNGNYTSVTGLTSNGTTLTMQVPSDAAPGNILVRINASGGASLSETHPFDPGSTDCDAPVNYCSTSQNSTGQSPVVSVGGTASLSANDLELLSIGLPSNQVGIFYYGPNQISTSFGNGTRCVGGTTKRLPIISIDSFGFVTYSLDVNNLPQGDTFSVGQAVNFQFWYRDPAAGGPSFNLTDAVEVTWCP